MISNTKLLNYFVFKINFVVLFCLYNKIYTYYKKV